MISLLEARKAVLSELCQRCRVAQLDVFGSAMRDDFDPKRSDLDFIVHFQDEHASGIFHRYLDFVDELKQLFRRSVNLLTEAMIKNPYFHEEIEETRQVIFDARREEAAV